MKKLAFLATVLFFQFTHAQDSTAVETVSPITLKKNEIKIDVLTLIARSRFHVSYERFLNKDFSVGLSASITKSNKKEDDFENGFNKTLPQYEANPFVRYSLSKSAVSYYFIEGFLSVNGGKYKELQRLEEGGTAYWTAVEKNYTDLAIGGALGYKLYIKEKFGIELFVGVGRNIINTDISPKYVQRVGANFGYRF
ncbi:hypothetical protein FCR2A7T_21630 [Flavobacterium cauense R2A-7]|uniref:Uncharacterized protein DUF3575 n=1 Tax=Flavobacterium cauense R2A-7 TaxID=1341154 RepID=V6S308_9FLAO|nr:DUF3575 domain-containing protein [Flavobacterium cauense]ESU18760.1 hypothetical protein FCR2A7T_21630 [Flavobacterium cauense R2A-7]KGO81765.1 hypothetical protein Q762_07940 [Flavobacterium cauense R2A-7]TWI13798.1 uncharacterized protein DUF3575 [Flavobacterium cauense R2A-7]